ncbi:MAG: tetratricopeptide repeat protein, partial [Blastocatellia bacterium]
GLVCKMDLRSVLQAVSDKWPPQLAQTLLEAYDKGAAGLDESPDLEIQYIKARILRRSGSPGLAADAASIAIEHSHGAASKDLIPLIGCHTLVASHCAACGNQQEANAHLDQALQLTDSMPEESATAAAAVLHELANLLRQNNRAAAARKLLEESLRVAGSQPGLEDQRVADILRTLADMSKDSGSMTEAVRHLQRAVAIIKQSNVLNPELVTSLNQLAELYQVLEESEPARACLEEALFIEETINGADSETADIIRSNLIRLLIDISDLPAACAQLQNSVKITQAKAGSGEKDIAARLKYLADVFEKLGEIQEAANCLRQALSIEEHVHGSEDPLLVVPYKRLADFELAAGDEDSAIRHRRRVLEIEEAVFGNSDARILPNLLYLEMLLRRNGQKDASIQLMNRARVIKGATEFPARQVPPNG